MGVGSFRSYSFITLMIASQCPSLCIVSIEKQVDIFVLASFASFFPNTLKVFSLSFVGGLNMMCICVVGFSVLPDYSFFFNQT